MAVAVITDSQWLVVAAAGPVGFSKKADTEVDGIGGDSRGKARGSRGRQGESTDQDAGLTPARGRRGEGREEAPQTATRVGVMAGGGGCPSSEGRWPRQPRRGAAQCTLPRHAAACLQCHFPFHRGVWKDRVTCFPGQSLALKGPSHCALGKPVPPVPGGRGDMLQPVTSKTTSR